MYVNPRNEIKKWSPHTTYRDKEGKSPPLWDYIFVNESHAT